MKFIYKIIKNICSVCIGTILWTWLLVKNHNTYYVIADSGIGDIIPTCGFLPAYRKKKGIMHITMISKTGKEEIYQMYEDTYDTILYFSEYKYQVLLSVFPYDIGKIFLRTKRVISTRLGTHTRGEYIYRITTYFNAIRCGTYELSENNPILPPRCIKVNITELIKTYKIKKGKTVILNPYANTIIGVPLDVFTQLGMKLKERGYQVITNLSSLSQNPISGTEGVVMSLMESYEMANYCGYIVGIRSGWIDLMAFADCKIVALYPKDYLYANFCNIREVNEKLEDFVIQRENEDMEKILGLLKMPS